MEENTQEHNFNLSKIKTLPGGGLRINYQVTQNVAGETALIDRDETSSRLIHPDLQDLFDALRPIVGRVFGFTSFLTLVEGKEMGLTEGKKALARAFADELLKRIEIRGIALSGSEEKRGVIITAVLETSERVKTCINTPRLQLATETFGFEEQLTEIVEKISAEVQAYLFKGKQAQLSLFGEDE